MTGNNRFFTLTPAEARALGLKPSNLVAISPAGSSHLRALAFTHADHASMGAGGAKTLLFRPERLTPAARAYFARGEDRASTTRTNAASGRRGGGRLSLRRLTCSSRT